MADFATLRRWASDAWKKQAPARREAEKDLEFYDGHQWTAEELNDLKEMEREAIVFNRTSVVINTVAGSEINSRTEVRYMPREMGDAKVNEVLTAGGEWFRDSGMAEDAESESFADMLKCGLGWTDTRLDYEEDPEGAPVVERIDPLEMGYDPSSMRNGLSNARYRFRVRKMGKLAAEERFDRYKADEIHAGWIEAAGAATESTSHAGDDYAHSSDEDRNWSDEDDLTVVQMQYCEPERMVEFINPETGQRDEMSRKKFDQLAAAGVPLMSHRMLTKKVWRQAMLGQNRILEETQPDKNGPTLHCMTGHWDRKERRWYGLLRSMKQPQRYANAWLSQSLHIFAANAKGGVMVEEGAVDDFDDFEDNWARADGVQYVKKGALTGGKIQEKPKGQMPPFLFQMQEAAITAIRDGSGVNQELVGLREMNQPGVLEYERKQSAMTTLAFYFDALRFYRKQQGKTVLSFLVNWIAPTGRLVRIVQGGQEQYVQLAMDAGVGTYDVVVDDAPSSPHEKERNWSIIQPLIPLMMQMGAPPELMVDIAEFSPLPSSLIDKLRTFMEEAKAREEQQGQEPSLEEQEQMAKLQKTQSEIAENRAETELDRARTAEITAQMGMAMPPMGPVQ